MDNALNGIARGAVAACVVVGGLAAVILKGAQQKVAIAVTLTGLAMLLLDLDDGGGKTDAETRQERAVPEVGEEVGAQAQEGAEQA